MRTLTSFSTMMLVLLAAIAPVAADERSDAKSFQELLVKINDRLPSGWIVEAALTVSPKDLLRPGPYPTLIIKSTVPLPLEFVGINLPGRSSDEPKPPPRINPDVVTLRFVARPFMSSRTYAAAREHNEVLQKKRLEFERQHLKDVASAHMGPEPIPPHAYRPRSEREIELVRQYAFLWLSTEPQLLPTHFTDDLSFALYDLGDFTIHDADKDKEYHQILESIQELITPYEQEP
jgi:hypothetical protein